MTHNPIRVLEDGTRVYSNGVRRKPVPEHLRKYGHRKPDVEGAVLWSSRWWLPLVLIEDDKRVMPVTRPDTDAYDHMVKPRKCKCDVCKRPEAKRWKNQWRREQRQMRTVPPLS